MNVLTAKLVFKQNLLSHVKVQYMWNIIYSILDLEGTRFSHGGIAKKTKHTFPLPRLILRFWPDSRLFQCIMLGEQGRGNLATAGCKRSKAGKTCRSRGVVHKRLTPTGRLKGVDETDEEMQSLVGYMRFRCKHSKAERIMEGKNNVSSFSVTFNLTQLVSSSIVTHI